jgi:hypothetical protein
MANAAEKRRVPKILFSNREIDGKNIQIVTKNCTRKATNLVAVLLGAPSDDNVRKTFEFSVFETDDLKQLFMSQEWKQLKALHNEITVQKER